MWQFAPKSIIKILRNSKLNYIRRWNIRQYRFFWILLIYSYRVKYNGLLASLFLSSLEMLLRELTLLESTVFSCSVFNLYAPSCDIGY
jgi:hypothetical protein